MSDAILKQKDLYKNHLEFLGYQVEYDPDDEQEMSTRQDGVLTFVRIYQGGLRALIFYTTSENAQKDRMFLEFVNECNMNRIAKVSINKRAALVIEMYYMCAYEKISFGEFIKLLDDERRKIVKAFLEKDFLE